MNTERLTGSELSDLLLCMPTGHGHDITDADLLLAARRVRAVLGRSGLGPTTAAALSLILDHILDGEAADAKAAARLRVV